MEYSVIIRPSQAGGYWVEVPALPHCYSQGETVEEAMDNAKNAIVAYLALLKEKGSPIPQDEAIIRKVSVAA